MIQTFIKPLSIDEFLKLPETKPACELIDGVAIPKPSPQGKHSTIQLDLGSSINLALKPQRIARAYSEWVRPFRDTKIRDKKYKLGQKYVSKVDKR